MEEFVYDKVFEKEDFVKDPLLWREFEKCTFRNCGFFQCDLKGMRFSSCRFENCDLSLATIDDAVLQEVEFTGCKILGVKFNRASRFAFSVLFSGCILDNSSFREMKLKKTVFSDCRLKEVDFSECDLTSSVFEKCDLEGAVFHFSNLEKADLRTAVNFSIDPEVNKLKKASFSLLALPGLLGKYGLDIEGI